MAFKGGNPYLGLKRLNKKHERFIKEYAITGNGAESARKAGYTGKVEVTACKLLESALIREALEAEYVRLSNEYDVKTHEILKIYMDCFKDTSAQWKDKLHAADSLAKIKQLMSNNTTTEVNIQSELLQSPVFQEVTKHKIA